MKSGTCIAGIAQNGVVWLGSDSLELHGEYFVLDAGTKLFVKSKPKMIMGGTGFTKTLDIVRFSFQPPKHDNALSDYEYMTTTFIRALCSCLEREKPELSSVAKKYKTSKGDDDEDEDENMELLVGYKGTLYLVSEESSTPISCGFMAVGSSREVAVGSLYTTGKIQETAERRLLLALSASEFFINSVRRPFYIINSAGYEKVHD